MKEFQRQVNKGIGDSEIGKWVKEMVVGFYNE